MVAKTFGIVALRKDFPATDLKEFIAYAKANPGKVNLGHAGVGSSNYLICKSFVQAAGIDVTLVGYRGAAPALTDAIGGQIDGVCDSAASVSQAIDDKLVQGIVVGSTVRLGTLPDLPTSAEAGLPEFEAQGWNGLFAPKGTPPEIIAKLNAAARASVESDPVKKRFTDLSTVAPDASEHAPDVLQQLVTRDVAKYNKLLTRNNPLPEAAPIAGDQNFSSRDFRMHGAGLIFAECFRSPPSVMVDRRPGDDMLQVRQLCQIAFTAALALAIQPALAKSTLRIAMTAADIPTDDRHAEQRLRGHALPRLPDLRGAGAVGPDQDRPARRRCGRASPRTGSRSRTTRRPGSSTCARRQVP